VVVDGEVLLQALKANAIETASNEMMIDFFMVFRFKFLNLITY
jgi:hypothetical protein